MRSLLLVLALFWALPSHASEPQPEAVLADLPFLDFPEPHRIVVDLAPEGSSRALRFILGTGASHTVATPRAAKELGLRVRKHKRDPYRRRTVLGRDVQILVDTRSSDTASKTGWEYALLGGNFLHRYVLELDFVARRVRFLDPKKFEVPEGTDTPGEAVLHMKTATNRPGVEVELNGEAILVLVDTGTQIPILVSGKIAEAVGLTETAIGGGTTHGVLGEMISEIRILDELKLGPFAFAGVPTVVNPRGFYNQAMSGGSLIGYELLEQFKRVRIDYDKRRLWLERNPNAVLTFGGQPFGSLDDPFDLDEPESSPEPPIPAP